MANVENGTRQKEESKLLLLENWKVPELPAIFLVTVQLYFVRFQHDWFINESQ